MMALSARPFARNVIIVGLVIGSLVCSGSAARVNASALCSSSFAYPAAFRNGSVVHDFFGQTIADPYRWLEHPDSADTRDFVQKENDVTNEYLHTYADYSAVKKMVTKLHDYPRYGAPGVEGSWLYYFYNSGLQNQSVLYRQRSTEAIEKEVVFDPNLLSEDGTISLSSTVWSEDGKYAGLMLSEGGSDWNTIKVLDLVTKKTLSETLERVKFSGFSWTQDNEGFFYNMYPVVLEGQATGTNTDANLNQKLYYHRAGTPQRDDVLCAEFPDNPSWNSGVEVTKSDGRYAVMSISRSTESRNALWYSDLSKLDGGIKGLLPWTKLFEDFDAEYIFLTNNGSLFYIKTNLNAPNHKIIAVDVERPESTNWVTLIPENPQHFLESARIAYHDRLILQYIEDVKSAMYMHDLGSGKRLHTFDVGINTVTQISLKEKHPVVFYKLESFINPGTIYKLDLSKSTTPTVFREMSSPAFDTLAYETTQVFYPSTNGTKIPMFITHRKGLALGPQTPCMLYGYGGFHIPMRPSFSSRFTSFIKAFDGILAVANIRGGSEYGESWWEQGALKNKQNCFTDFQNAAEYLQKQNYTSRDKLVILGGSNGGLLVGACSNQRPDLFGAAIPMVGVMDMLRFHKFTIGHYWTSDYGNPDVKEDFDVLIKYSPLHNIRQQTVQYPATLVVTADHDDRVAPLHSLKYIAELQHRLCEGEGDVVQTNPLMIRVETKAGHGAGKSTTKAIEETTDIMVFSAKSLDYTWKGSVA